ncbi:MAG: IS1634 family transposase, partial [Luteimonas sp.]|nr:IS1634 family transposase [Luteimonas sp.]
MFVKLTRSGSRRYVQLVESYRDEAGKPRQRTIATVGRLDEADGAVQSLLSGLLRATGQPAATTSTNAPPALDTPGIRFDSSLAYGDVFALDRLWHELGFDEIATLLRSARLSFDAEALVRAMVFNRLCDASSKLGLLRWLQTTWLPGVDAAEVTHQRLLRTMDALQAQADAVAALVSRLLRPLIDQRLSVVFYDLTTIRAEGLSEQPGELRRFGLAKEGVIARQCLLSVVQTAEGLPISHRVWRGNVAETSTLASAIAEVTRNYPVQRIVLVADRGLLSVDNLAMLDALKVAGGPLEYIVAVPGRRYAEFVQVLADVQPLCVAATDEVIGEVPWSPAKAKESSVKRLLWAHDPLRAAEQSQQRQTRMDALLARAEQCAAKLDAQDAGQTSKGRKLSDAGAKARLYHEVIEARLGRIIEVDLKHEQLSWKINEDHLAQARLMDGKLLLVSNVAELTPTEVVQRYKSLADIERGFHVLKSEIEIAPMFHRLPERIRAHALICFIALVLHRVMRMRLKAAGSKASPERALQLLRQLQRHRVHL